MAKFKWMQKSDLPLNQSESILIKTQLFIWLNISLVRVIKFHFNLVFQKYNLDLSQLSCQDYSVEKSMSSAADPSEYPQDEQQPKEIFFKEINFSPDLTIRMDYQVNYPRKNGVPYDSCCMKVVLTFMFQGKRVETSDYGTLLGLIIGLGQLNCSQITFKRYLNKNG